MGVASVDLHTGKSFPESKFDCSRIGPEISSLVKWVRSGLDVTVAASLDLSEAVGLARPTWLLLLFSVTTSLDALLCSFLSL